MPDVQCLYIIFLCLYRKYHTKRIYEMSKTQAAILLYDNRILKYDSRYV